MCLVLPKLINNNNNSNTGIVLKSILQKLFPKHNTMGCDLCQNY